LIVPWSSFRPESYHLTLLSGETEEKAFSIPGKGLFYQADACARALRDNKLETSEYPLADSLDLMEVMDLIREVGGFKYSDELELV
jgi:hypothetical protein